MLKGLHGKTEIENLKEGLRSSFGKIRSEMDDHLNAINENSAEVQSIYDHLAELNAKIDKIAERLDEIQMYVSPDVVDQRFSADLTYREQEVFVVLYSEPDRVSLKGIAKKLGFTDEMVNTYVYNLIAKGIPILKQIEGGELWLCMDLKFKDLQARKSVVKINETISRELLSDSVNDASVSRGNGLNKKA